MLVWPYHRSYRMLLALKDTAPGPNGPLALGIMMTLPSLFFEENTEGAATANSLKGKTAKTPSALRDSSFPAKLH